MRPLGLTGLMRPQLVAVLGISTKRIIRHQSQPSRIRVSAASASSLSSSSDRAPPSLATTPQQGLSALHQGPGVYAVYDKGGALQYVGMSRQVAASVAAHAEQLPAGMVASTCVWPIPGGAKPAMQHAWKAWIVEHGSVPPGNAPGDTTWTAPRKAGAAGNGGGSGGAAAAAAAARAAASTAAAVVPSSEELRLQVVLHAHAMAQAAVTEKVLQQLDDQGFVVIDGVSVVIVALRSLKLRSLLY